ncbi:MAG: hypothetical protein HXX80_00720 [Nitrososphaerales archaeon]|nr:hypothetical protein [Nitrososphaerales archaeon]
MSILSRIRSWFGGAKDISIAPDIVESHQLTVEEANKDSKAEELVEAMKVAYEEQPQPIVEPVVIQPESISSYVQPESNPSPIQNETTLPYEDLPVQCDGPAIDAPTSLLLASPDISNTIQPAPLQLMDIQTESVPAYVQPESVASPIQIENTPSYDNTPTQFDSLPVIAPTIMVAIPPEGANIAQIDNPSAQPQSKQKPKRSRSFTRSKSRSRSKKKLESVNSEA